MGRDVRRNDSQNRYELVMGGTVVGVADYRIVGDTVVMPHTQIDPSHRGQGLGAVLVRAALDDIRSSGRTVDAQCWFVAEFIEANEEYADLLAA
jgi:uncharacterized protein